MAPTVGIFSRSCEEDYAWLRVRLQEFCEVLCVLITNTNNSDVQRSIRQCQHAILYHTKNRGRINITDVTDSLYDDEIRQMSSNLGKENVFAVIDDLEDSSAAAKTSILSRQHALRDLTEEVILFTAMEKQNEAILREKLRPITEAIQRDNRFPGNAIKFVGYLALTAFVYQEAYRSPNHINLILVSFWTVKLSRTLYLYKKPMQALSFRRLAFKTLGYSLALYGFYKCWQMQDPTNVWELIVRTALRSPASFMVVSSV